MTAGRRAAFLDRDGVINIDTGYVHRWEDYVFVPGAVEAIRRLSQAGYGIVVVTNQSGIARGYFSEGDYQALSERLSQVLRAGGADLLGIHHCPHHPKGTVPALAIHCDCRKPSPGLILDAARRYGIDLAASFLVGDKPSDIQAARAARVGRAYRVRSDNDESLQGQPNDLPVDAYFDSLSDCVNHLLAMS